MHWESYYIPPKHIRGQDVHFPQSEAKHLFRVMRKNKDDEVWIVDGEGSAHRVRILSASPNSATGKIVQSRRRLGEPSAEITLASSVLKGERFDWLVEKCTEIGVRRILPMLTERTIPSAGMQKHTRWKRVAVAAMKQSARSILPEIAPARNFAQVIAMGAASRYRFIAHAGGETLDRHWEDGRSHTGSSALLLVGPEGGFTDLEMAGAVENGFTPIRLGPRRLRSETAGILLASLLLSRLGEFL